MEGRVVSIEEFKRLVVLCIVVSVVFGLLALSSATLK